MKQRNIKLEIINNKKSLLVSKKFLRDFLCFVEKALVERQILPLSFNKKLVIAFVSPVRIQKLNKSFLKKDRVTDVLSFSPIEENSFGELALCEEKIRSQAKDHNLTLEEETAYLVLHGWLHLLGYQHDKRGHSAKIMYKIQDEIFSEWRSFQIL